MPFWSGVTDWIGGAAGTVGDALGTAAERYAGINDTKFTAPTVDANAYRLGIGGLEADQAGMRYQGLGAQAMAKDAPSVYSAAYEADRARDLDARNAQGRALGMQAALAQGRGPSLAAMQAQQGMRDAMAQQSSIANSARGGGANLAAAQRAAALGTANAAGQIQRAATQARVQEQLGALNAYGQQAGAMRGQDMARTGQSGQMGVNQANARLTNQGQAYGFAGQMENLGFQTGAKQLDATMARDAAVRSGDMFRQTGQAGVDAANTKATADSIQRVGSATVSAFTQPSDERLKEGIHSLGGGGLYGQGSDAAVMGGAGLGGADWEARSKALPGAFQGGGMRQGGMMQQQPSALGALFSDQHSKERISFLESLVAGTKKQPGMSHPSAPSQQADGSMLMPDGSVQRSRFDLPIHKETDPDYAQWKAEFDRSRLPQPDAINMNAGLERHDPGAVSLGMAMSDARSKEMISALQAENASLRAKMPTEDLQYDDRSPSEQAAWAQRHAKPSVAEEARFDDRSPAEQAAWERRHAPPTAAPVATPTVAQVAPQQPGVLRRALSSIGSALGSTPAYAAMPAVSDERAKTDAKHAAPADFMDHLEPYAFNYKRGVPGEDPSQRRYGVMAQDVEKSPMGASFVEDTPEGKQLDIKHGFGTTLAALGNLHDRLKALESRKGKR